MVLCFDSSRTVTVEKSMLLCTSSKLVGLGKTTAIEYKVPEQYLVYFIAMWSQLNEMQVDEEGCFHGYEAVSPEQV